MRSRTVVALLASAAFAATGLAACGDDDDETAAPPAPPPATQTETAEAQPPAAATVDVAAAPGGDLAYVQDSLTAPAGSVTFAFTNEASIPHDFNIERDGEQIGGTEVISESEENLTVDLEPGEYTYYCSVANHREAGMEGSLSVE